MSIIISELLCYVLRKYGRTPNNHLKCIVAGFYTSSEVTTAKDLIFKSAEDIKVDSLPRNIKRIKNKLEDRLRRKQEVDDILILVDSLDEKGVLAFLPKFVADDISRFPPFKTEDLDVCLLAIRVAAIEEQLSFNRTMMTSVNQEKTSSFEKMSEKSEMSFLPESMTPSTEKKKTSSSETMTSSDPASIPSPEELCSIG